MGVAFSVVPAVIWPATAMLVEPRRLGTAFGLINVLQSLGMAACNLAAGWLADRATPDARIRPATPMLWYFFLLSLAAFVAVAALWRRESGPVGHGLERVDVSRQADDGIRSAAGRGRRAILMK